MPSKVTLLFIEGPLSGAKYSFEEKMTCIIGRSDSAQLVIPPEASVGVSRHHCLLEISPPAITVQDMGSLNGTYINSQKIGQGRCNDSDGMPLAPVSYELNDGDVLKIGKNKILVARLTSRLCARCSAELSSSVESGSVLCEKCTIEEQARQTLRKYCRICGTLIDHPVSTTETDPLCSICAVNEDNSVKKMIQTARMEIDNKGVMNIKGFKIIRQIGRGGMGAVYLAEWEVTHGECALKVMLPSVSIDETARRSFLRETENMRILTHKNIVGVMASGYLNGIFYIAMEYCDGGTLKEFMKRRNAPLAWKDALEIIWQLLDALEYAHNVEIPSIKLENGSSGGGKGLIHRDINPANLFFCGKPGLTSGTVSIKLADFGLSKSFESAGLSGCTRTGAFSGTLGFISRQQFLNFKYARPEVDIWAVAATLYYMLTCTTPREFKGKNAFTVILEAAPLPVRSRNENIPEKLASVIDLALDDNTMLHFKKVSDFRDALRESVSCSQ